MKPDSAPSMIAVDWGSTSFRAMLISGYGELIGVVRSKQGIVGTVYDDFATALDSQIGSWRALYPALPIVMSGMIGSRSGWHEVPHVDCPAAIDQISASLHPVTDYAGRAWIIPGLSGLTPNGVPDLMRGEEVQLAGALPRAGHYESPILAILPGTHSKWALVAQGKVIQFATSISGELFALLSEQGSLAMLLKDSDSWSSDDFAAGLALAKSNGGLGHHIFTLRSGCLLGRISGVQAKQQLSGLLIGHELKEMLKIFPSTPDVTIIGDTDLVSLYSYAFEKHGMTTSVCDGEYAAMQGSFFIAQAAGLIKAGESL